MYSGGVRRSTLYADATRVITEEASRDESEDSDDKDLGRSKSSNGAVSSPSWDKKASGVRDENE